MDFLLPSLGADMDEAKLVRWLVAPGDQVHKGQIIAEVETEKALLEVECWQEGVIEELLVAPGPAKMQVGTVLARIRTTAEAPTVATKVSELVTPPAPPLTEISPPLRHLAHELGVDIATVTATGVQGALTREDIRRAARPLPHPAGKRIKASPRARQLAAQLEVDLAAVTPSRPDGLVTAEDVTAIKASGARAVTQPEGVTPASDEDDRASAMRRAISRSMSRSNREIPHYYLGTHIDLSRAVVWLEEYNTQRPLTERVLIAVLLLKAAALALRANPQMNGHWIDDRFQPSESVHLGVAISLRQGGLVAPAIHDADKLDLQTMMESLRDLVNRARSWRLRSSEMSDPTATVTNLGERGVETAFPIIIPPQVAMVGFGKVIEAPVAREGMLGVAPIVQATLSGDHRATDGHQGGLLLSSLDRLLQEPEQL